MKFNSIQIKKVKNIYKDKKIFPKYFFNHLKNFLLSILDDNFVLFSNFSNLVLKSSLICNF